MENEIMVSIYCLAFNHEKYIRQTLEGFVTQKTNFKFEVIVHDDASTDKTAEIIKEFEEKYPLIIKPIYQKENQHSQGKNITQTFIKPLIKGKYIAVCEGDDYWCDTEKLQRQIDILEANPEYSACVHQTLQINCKTGEKRNISPYNRDCVIDLKTIISGGNQAFQLSSLVYRNEYFYTRPDFCTKIKNVGDYPLSIYLGLSGSIYFINKTMSVYRKFSGDTSWNSKMTANADKWIENCNMMITMLNMADEYSELKYHDYFNLAVSHFEYDIVKTQKKKSIFLKKKYRQWLAKESGKAKIYLILRTIIPEKYLRIKELLKRNNNG